MKVVNSISGVRQQVRAYRSQARTVVFVPTMGNLHQGHIALIKKAQEYNGPVVVSLFVNPLQFGPNEDFSTYPRTLQRDQRVLEEQGVDVLFLPEEQTMYPRGLEHQTKVEVPELGNILEGVTRPHFFKGVATVVNRLFNIVQADIAVFGKKDYQQWIVIRRMVADLAMPIEIVGVDTVREEDGLALSSRNSYLNEAQRRIAPALHRTLRRVGASLGRGQRHYAQLEKTASAELVNSGLKPDYISIRCARDLTIPRKQETDYVVLGAVYLGQTRLIDNVEVSAA